MTHSVRRSLRLFNWSRKQEGSLQSPYQTLSSSNVAFQNSNYAGNSSGRISIGNNGSYSERNSDYPIQVGQTGRMLEVGNGYADGGHLNVGTAQSNYSDIQSGNNFSHQNLPSLKARFGRSCRAFVNAWRMS
ncbi:MAG: hypothetical protein JWO37_4135 [Acidimicrobiales bacterium]|nr:hypothetical protein [Acidimicrobiales bacterium]